MIPSLQGHFNIVLFSVPPSSTHFLFSSLMCGSPSPSTPLTCTDKCHACLGSCKWFTMGSVLYAFSIRVAWAIDYAAVVCINWCLIFHQLKMYTHDLSFLHHIHLNGGQYLWNQPTIVFILNFIIMLNWVQGCTSEIYSCVNNACICYSSSFPWLIMVIGWEIEIFSPAGRAHIVTELCHLS